jgi:hypothetical protein
MILDHAWEVNSPTSSSRFDFINLDLRAGLKSQTGWEPGNGLVRQSMYSKPFVMFAIVHYSSTFGYFAHIRFSTFHASRGCGNLDPEGSSPTAQYKFELAALLR